MAHGQPTLVLTVNGADPSDDYVTLRAAFGCARASIAVPRYALTDLTNKWAEVISDNDAPFDLRTKTTLAIMQFLVMHTFFEEPATLAGALIWSAATFKPDYRSQPFNDILIFIDDVPVEGKGHAVSVDFFEDRNVANLNTMLAGAPQSDCLQ